jgi:methylthioribose-1-phosphate isomerase
MRAIEWTEGRVQFLDQTRLPLEELVVTTDDESVVIDAIKRLAIRGAPLIGIAAAYALVLAVQRVKQPADLLPVVERTATLLVSTRPTAVNLSWAVQRMKRKALGLLHLPPSEVRSALIAEAIAIHQEDERMCEAIGRHGASILPLAATVLTHCNTGSLATGGRGTALAVIVTAWEQRILKHVYIDETRPLLQGARLTAWELQKIGVPCTLITDATAPFLMQRGMVNAVVVGADRITKLGDVANKIGTYGLAVSARHHQVPFIVAAPTTTIDPNLEHGSHIPIEERSPEEVTQYGGIRIAPKGVDVYAPAFDVTPHELITAIVTERGVASPPFSASLPRMVEEAKAIHRVEEGAG